MRTNGGVQRSTEKEAQAESFLECAVSIYHLEAAWRIMPCRICTVNAAEAVTYVTGIWVEPRVEHSSLTVRDACFFIYGKSEEEDKREPLTIDREGRVC